MTKPDTTKDRQRCTDQKKGARSGVQGRGPRQASQYRGDTWYMPRMVEVKKETGNIYGRLKVEDQVATGRAAWNCRCACGRPFVTTGERLRNGKATSCGCQPEPEKRSVFYGRR